MFSCVDKVCFYDRFLSIVIGMKCPSPLIHTHYIIDLNALECLVSLPRVVLPTFTGPLAGGLYTSASPFETE